MARKPKPLIERLMAKVIIHESGCWIWEGTVNGAGYGTIGLGSRLQGKGFVHRVSYEFHNGPLKDGQCVCHACDVKLCVNPDHLFAGTQLDNVHDAICKGRITHGDKWRKRHLLGVCKGESHGMAKLSEDQVREIIKIFGESKMNKAQLARKFNVCRATIRNIVNKRNWSHLAG